MDSSDELAQLREQLEAARADVDRLQLDTADANARAEQAAADAGQFRDQLAQTSDALTAASAEREALRTQAAATAERSQHDTARYRDLVVRAEPAVPPELIAGDTIAAIDDSLAAARTTVGRVRSHLEAQSQAARVPAGAPPRSAPDLSALSPEQKIRLGLQRKDA